MSDTNLQSGRQAAELISRAITMDLWSLTEHTKVTRKEFLDALARIQQQAKYDAVTLEYRSKVIGTQNERADRDAAEIARLRGALELAIMTVECASEREVEPFRNPCEHGCPKDDPCPCSCECACHTDEPVRYRALRNLLEMKHDRMTRLEGEIARLREVLASIQWCSDDGNICQLCPICGQSEMRGHSPDCMIGAVLTAEAKPEAPAPATECACRKALELALSMIDQNYPVAASVDDCRATLATPCSCTELREEAESDKWKQLDIAVSDNGRLRAELAAANERAERAERDLTECRVGHKAALADCEDYEQKIVGICEVIGAEDLELAADKFRRILAERDTAQAGWKEAVEEARKMRGFVKPFGLSDYMPDDSESEYDRWTKCAKALTENRARFDAQGGGK